MTPFLLILAHSKWVHFGFAALGTLAIVLVLMVKYSRTKKYGLVALVTSLAIAADVLLLKYATFAGTAINFWHLKSKISFMHRLDFFSGFVRENLFELGAPLVVVVAALLYLIWTSIRYLVSSKEVAGIAAIALCGLSVILSLGLTLPALFLVLLFQHHRTKVKETKLSGSDVYEKDELLGLHRIEQSLKPDSCDGIEIFPKLQLTASQECTHLLLVGAQGSGKTNLLFGILRDIINRGDKAIVYDYKHDFCSHLFGDPRVALLTPFDERSFAWDVAKDINTELDAEEFAKVLCPDEPHNGKPFFAMAARDLIVGCIKKLQVEMEGKWTFSDLYGLVSLKENIEAACRAHRIEALQTIGSAENDQGLGVIGELRNRTKTLGYLAKAWPDRTNALSISEWLKANDGKNAIIIQSNPRFGELDRFFTVQIYSYLFREVLSFEDSHTRRVWAVIDELPTLPMIPDFTNSLRAGRSKGLCVVAAVQDFGRLKEIYSRDGGLEAISNGFGIKLVGRLNSFEAAEYASQLCGDIELERTTISRSEVNGKKSRSEQPGQLVKKRAVPANTFLNLKLCNKKEPARFFFISSGLPIVCMKHHIVNITKNAGSNMRASWMAKTPKEEFDFAKLPKTKASDFAIRMSEVVPC